MNILPRPSEIEAELINNTAGNVTIKATVTDAETGELVPNGPVEVYVNGTLVGTGEVVDGIAVIKTNITEIGNYDFDVKYLGNENYTESNTTVNDDVVGRPSEITAEPGNEELGNSTVKVNLTDAETGKPIPNAPVIITLPDGTNVTGTTDENGFVEVPVDLPVGNHTLEVTYPGNETYTPSKTTVDMEILPIPTNIEPEVVNPIVGETEIEIVVKDSVTGDVLANKPVVITLPDGTKINATTDENGKLRSPVDLPAGENNLVVDFAGDDEYSPSTTPFVVNVVKRNATLTPEVVNRTTGEAVVEITAVDDLTGKPVVNGTIELTLPNGTVLKAITDENGVARFENVDVPVGVNDFDAKLIENPIYNEADTDVTIKTEPTDIKDEVINNIIGDTEIELVLKNPDTGDLLADKEVTVTLPDGKTITKRTDDDGKLRLPLDLPAGENNLVVDFAGDEEYGPSTHPMVVDVVKRNATLTPTVKDNTNGTAVVDILATDDLTGKPIVNGTIELTLANGTKVTAITDENGIATFVGVNVPVGETVFDAKLIENPIYNEADTNLTLDNVPKLIIIGEWKLVRVNVTVNNATDSNITHEQDTVKPVVKNNGKVVPKVKSLNKYQQKTAKYNKYNKNSKRANRYNKRPSWNKPAKGTPIHVPAMTKEQYKLFINLYGEFLDGDMSFSDFIVVLKLNGIEIASTNSWDENGQITLTYDDINEVPDSIEIRDNSGHFSDYNDNIEKNNAPSSSGEIDKGDINVEQKASSHSASKASDSVSNTASESASAAEA